MLTDHKLEETLKFILKAVSKWHCLSFYFRWKGPGTISKMPRKLIQYIWKIVRWFFFSKKKDKDIVEEDIEVKSQKYSLRKNKKQNKTDEQVLFSEEGEEEHPGPAFAKKKHEDFPGGSDGRVSAYWGRPRFSPWVGKISWKGNGHSLQYSGLENPMDGGVWRATVHGVAKSQTRLSRHARLGTV